MVDSTRSRRRRKAKHGRPAKPYPEFPLYAHPLGYWSKKVNGTILHFGSWAKVVNKELTPLPYEDGWQAALRVYKARIDDAQSGRLGRGSVVNTADARVGLTVADLCNRFLTAKLRKKDSREIGTRTFQEYRDTTDLLIGAFGAKRVVESLTAEDFEALRASMTKKWGPVRLGNSITRVKSVFKYGVDNGHIDRAVRFGSEFKKPGKSVMRRHRAANGERMLEPAQLRQLITAAPVPLRAMILLGLNCGFGNGDCAALPLSAPDLDRATVDYPRPKTGIERRCPLWPETVEALRAVLAARPAPATRDGENLVFLNSRGSPWVCVRERSRTDNVAIQFGNLLKGCGLHRDGLGFYTLRHVFRTAADAARDPVAIDLIMGHADPSMGGHYRERIDDSRLKAVTDHVRAWLFGAEGVSRERRRTPHPATGS
jgi:integrase